MKVLVLTIYLLVFKRVVVAISSRILSVGPWDYNEKLLYFRLLTETIKPTVAVDIDVSKKVSERDIRVILRQKWHCHPL